MSSDRPNPLLRLTDSYRIMIENSMDVVTVTNTQGIILYASPSTRRVLGHDAADILGSSIFDHIHPDDSDVFSRGFARSVSVGDSTALMNFRFRHVGGVWLYLESIGRLILSDEGEVLCVLNSRDVTERIRSEREWQALALSDGLTGLHNRRSLINLLVQQIRVADRSLKPFYLLMADLDSFKDINDRHGHAEGDEALKDTARFLKNVFRGMDIIARIGGDEFVVVLTETSNSSVTAIANRLSRAMSEFNQKRNKPYRLCMSVGVIRYVPLEGYSAEQVLDRADSVMYASKRKGSQESSMSPDKQPDIRTVISF